MILLRIHWKKHKRMKDEKKTKAQLLNELTKLRQLITELDKSEAEHTRTKGT